MLVKNLYFDEAGNDGADGGGGAPAQDDATKKLADENASLKAKLDAQDKADKEAQRKAAAAKAAKEGKAAEELERIQAENEALRAKVEANEKAFRERVEGRFKALPDGIQEKIGDFRDKVPADVWADMVEREHASHSDVTPRSDGAPPMTPKPGGRRDGDPNVYRPTEKTMELLSAFGKEDVVQKLKSVKVRASGEGAEGVTAFSISMREVARARSPKPGSVRSTKD